MSRAIRAAELAERLAAEVEPGDPRWHGPDLAGDEQDWRIVDGPVDDGLYSGVAGIALALAAAARCGAPPAVAEVARAAAHGAVRRCLDRPLAGDRLDLASGSAGIAFATAWVGHLLDDAQLAEQARTLAALTAGTLSAVTLDDAGRDDAGSKGSAGPVDLLTGAAGTALAVAAVLPDQAESELALRAAAGRAQARARPHRWGVAWPDPSGHPDLLGLAHGTSGVAWALARAADPANPADPATRLLTGALEYERAWFDPHRPGWPDLRPLTAGPGAGPPGLPDTDARPAAGWPVAWCHGAVGIGLSRLALLELAGRGDRPVLAAEHDQLSAELGAAVQAARQRLTQARTELREHGRADDASLCHGLAGSVELLIAAGALPGAQAHLHAARRSADLLVAARNTLGLWPCGLPSPPGDDGGHEPPGLFLGLAGILLTLLRVDHAQQLPSPLLLTSVPRHHAPERAQ